MLASLLRTIRVGTGTYSENDHFEIHNAISSTAGCKSKNRCCDGYLSQYE